MSESTPSRARLETALVLIVCLFVSVGGASGAQISVNTTEDVVDTDGDCSLREAIMAANTNQMKDGCPAGGPGMEMDTISFTVSGTITLAGPLPALDFFAIGPLTIDGPGAANLTINGNNTGPILEVGNGRSLNVQALTIADGLLTGFATGAALRNNGTLTVSHTTFSNNRVESQGGAISSGNSATLTVTHSTFSGNRGNSGGGAIVSGGAMTVSNSTFTDNRTDFNGGAISSCCNSIGTTISDSTFSGNTAKISGGAIQSGGSLTVTNSTFLNNRAGGGPSAATGGAIFSGGNLNASLTLVNSTFSGNSANSGNIFVSLGGAIRNQGAPLSLTNVTMTGNSVSTGGGGGGIGDRDSTITFLNTILANNPGGNCPGSQTLFVDLGGNFNYPATQNCLIGTHADPQLLPLADNGGPTLTHALGACSPALDAGVNDNTPATDQRGEARLFGPYVDSGAYEAQTPRNNPPMADVYVDQPQLPAGPACTADVTLHGEDSSDADPEDTLTYSWSVAGATGATPTVPLFRGTHFINLDVSDGTCSDTDSVVVTVRDETGPVFSNVPGPIVECTSTTGTPVLVPLPTATDNCDSNIDVTSDAPATFPIGTTTVTFTAYDDSLNISEATTTVTVGDATPPAIASLSATPNVLWPPNHQMVPVTVSASASDSCGAATCRIVAVVSNEPDSNPAEDWEITGALTLSLRAERLGSGSGRVYEVTVECTDTAGNASRGVVPVTVPQSEGN